MKQSKIISLLILQQTQQQHVSSSNDHHHHHHHRRKKSSHVFPIHHPIHARKRARNSGSGNSIRNNGSNNQSDGIYKNGGDHGNISKRRLRGRPGGMSSSSSSPSSSSSNMEEKNERQRRQLVKPLGLQATETETSSSSHKNENDTKPNNLHNNLHSNNSNNNNNEHEDSRRRKLLNTVSANYLAGNPWYPSHDALQCLNDGNPPEWMTWEGGYAEAHLFDDGNDCCQRWFPDIDSCFAAVASTGNVMASSITEEEEEEEEEEVVVVDERDDVVSYIQQQEVDTTANDMYHNNGNFYNNNGAKVGPSVEYNSNNAQQEEQQQRPVTAAKNDHGNFNAPTTATTGDKYGSVNSMASVVNQQRPVATTNSDHGNFNTQETSFTIPEYNGRGHGVPLYGDHPNNNNDNDITTTTEKTFPTSSCGDGWSSALTCSILCLSGAGCPPGQSCHPNVPCPAPQVAAAMGNVGSGILELIRGGDGESSSMGISTDVCGEDYADAERRCRAGSSSSDDDDASDGFSLGFTDDFMACSSAGTCPGGMRCYGGILCPLPPTISPMPTRSPIPEYNINHNSEVNGGHGKSIVAYYASWQWYDREKLAQPLNLNYDMITRVNYAFFQTDVEGNIWGADPNADAKILFGEVSEHSRPGIACNIHSAGSDGCYCHNVGKDTKSCQFHNEESGLIYLAHRNGVDVYPSIGGWTLSESFPRLAASRTSREKFAENCIMLIFDYGFDGIDIDWEYPGYAPHGGTAADEANFVLLLRTVRSALDALGGQMGRYYGLTAALPCGPENIANQNLAEVAEVLDELNLMTYDFHGSWDVVTGHNAPLYDQPRDFEAGWSVHGCVENWVGSNSNNPLKEEHRSKVNIGLPFYGRSYLDATELYDVHGGNDVYSWYEDDGTPQFFNIQAKMEEDEMTSVRDDVTKTQYAYFDDGYGMISYDDERSICDKVGYVQDNGLGGFIIWEISGDMMDDFHQPLLEAVNRKLALPEINCKTSFGTPTLVAEDPVNNAAGTTSDGMISNRPIVDPGLVEEPIVRGDKAEIVGQPFIVPPPAPRPVPVSIPSNASPYTLDTSQFGRLAVAADSCSGGCPSNSKCVGNSAGGKLIKDEECAACSAGQTWWPCDVDGLCWCWADGTDRIAPAPKSGVDLYQGGGSHYTVCDDVLTREMFDSIAPDARDPYSYEGLCDAILSYNSHHSEKAFGMGDTFQRTAELAAFLGNTLHESDEFRAGREYLMCADHKVVRGEVYCKPCDPGSFDWGTFTCNRSLITGTSDFNEYCQPSSKPPEACNCGRGQGEGGSLEGYVAASDLFFGRGAIQLSWNYNYYGASVALTGSADTFCDNPDLVSTEGRYAWGAGLYFWMEHTKEETTSHMEALKDGGDFGGTLNNINGGLECPAHGGWHVDAVKARLNRYCRAARALGLPNLMRLDNCAGLQESMSTCLSEGKCDDCHHYAGKTTGKRVSNFVPAVVAPAAITQIEVTESAMPVCGEGLMPWAENPDCCVANTAFIGDGACDPDAPYNTAVCGYDGGDCCKDTCDQDWSSFGCTTKEVDSLGYYGPFGFFCIDPATTTQGASGIIDAELCDVAEKYRIGDGQCNPMYNTAACNYDGGDCCQESCDDYFSFYSCGSGVSSYECLDPMHRVYTDTPTTHPTTSTPTDIPTDKPAKVPNYDRPTPPLSSAQDDRTPSPTPRPIVSYSDSVMATMCPMDMMECPDGKYMPRNPDNGCAFDSCPETPQELTAIVKCKSGRKGCSGGESVGRDPNNSCRWFPCPETPQEVTAIVKCKTGKKRCPGGESVGRDPNNNCRWFQCPEVVEAPQEESPGASDSLASSISSIMEDAKNDFVTDRPTPKLTKRPTVALKPKLPKCKKDMLECPDTGKYVGRNPHNNCNFLECPQVIEKPKKPMESIAASINSSFGQDAPPPPPLENDHNGDGCTDEIIRCTDGSFVGKDPENDCKYFACPPSTNRPTPRPTPYPTERIVSMASSVHSKYNARVNCGKELHRCADGHYVGQDPDNNCEYYPCEEPPPTQRTTNLHDSKSEGDMYQLSEAISEAHAGGGWQRLHRKKRNDSRSRGR